MDLKETCLDSTVAYDGGFIKVLKDKVRLPDGSTSIREHITHPGAVAVLAILDNGNLIMERQFRYPPQLEFIELPAGKIDHGEDILLTAQRELLEETGYVAREWTLRGARLRRHRRGRRRERAVRLGDDARSLRGSVGRDAAHRRDRGRAAHAADARAQRDRAR